MAKDSLRDLRFKARKLGIEDYRELTPDELTKAIKQATGKNGSSTKVKAKKVVAKAVKKSTAKKRGRPKKVEAEVTPAPKKRGRPRKVEAEVVATPKKRGRPAKNKTTAKVTTKVRATKANPVGRPKGSGNGTRIPVPTRLDWKADFSFREGTIAGVILVEARKQAKKYKETDDIRSATYDALEDEIGNAPFIFKKRGGVKMKKAEAQAMLKYRVSRTILDYAIYTGQHDGMDLPNSGQVKPAAPKRRGRPPKSEATAPAKKAKRGRPAKKAVVEVEKPKRGRPPGSKTKTAAKRGPGRPKGSVNKVKASAKTTTAKPTGKRRGRPPGSRNKVRRA